MGSCREIVNLQLGSYSNYVGTHWWNLQESSFQYSPEQKSEICHDVLFREGLSLRGEVTFTPRVLCVEKGKLSYVSYLEDIPQANQVLWDASKVEKTISQPISKHPFVEDMDNSVDTTERDYSFESTIRSWPDFLKTKLLRRSVLTDYNSESNDEIEDRIRNLVEECDNMQGFHVIVDNEDNFTSVFHNLKDEFASKIIMAFPINDCKFEAGLRAAESLVRRLLTWECLAENASLSVPLSLSNNISIRSQNFVKFPFLNYDPLINYHTSAILGVFLETISLPYRLSSKINSIGDFIKGLNHHQMKFSAGAIAFPFAIKPGRNLFQTLEERDEEEDLTVGLTHGVDLKRVWYQSVCLRGVPNVGSVLDDYLKFSSNAISNVQTATSPLCVLQPFPKFFSPHVSLKGSVDLEASRAHGFHVATCPALGGLHSSPEIGKMILQAHQLATSINIRNIPRLSDLEMDLVRESFENIQTLGETHTGVTGNL